MMKNARPIIALTLAVLLLSQFPVGIFFLTVSAQSQVETTTQISVHPNPAEATINPVTVNITIQPSPPTAEDQFTSIKLTIIRPDGLVINNNYGSLTGFLIFEIYLSMTGTYTLKVNFDGQSFANGAINYLPSEAQTTFTRLPPPPHQGASIGSWAQKAPMNQARSGLGVAAVNGKIYAIGGSTDSGLVTSSSGSAVYAGRAGSVGTNEEYNPISNKWTYKAIMPTPRVAFATAVYKNKIYCIGGQTKEGYIGVNEVYDPATDTWETKTPMPTAKGWLTASVVNGKIHLLGGIPETLTNEVYDPETDTWTILAPIPQNPIFGYSRTTSAEIDNKIYLFGGFLNSAQYLHQIFDSLTDKWSSGSSPPSSVDGGAAGATTGRLAPKRVYLIGVAYSTPSYSNRVYDPQTNSWSAAADLPSKRYNIAVAVLDDKIYVIGGHTYEFAGNYAPVALNEVYTPDGYGSPDPSYVPPTEPSSDNQLLLKILSPLNYTYNDSSISLTYSVNRPVNWVGFSLDGKENVTLIGNTTLFELAGGQHNLTLYAKKDLKSITVQQSVTFLVVESTQASQNAPLIASSLVILALIGLIAILYSRWTKKFQRKKSS